MRICCTLSFNLIDACFDHRYSTAVLQTEVQNTCKTNHLPMADNVIAFRCSSVIYPHLLLSLLHFQYSLSTFSIERVNGISLWDFYASDFQRALKIIIIVELFIVLTISPG